MLPQTSSSSSHLPLPLTDKSPFHPLDLVRVSGPPHGRRRVVAAARMSASQPWGGGRSEAKTLAYLFICSFSLSLQQQQRRTQASVSARPRCAAADGSVPWTAWTWTDEHLEARPAEVATATPKPKLARPLKLLRVDAGSEASLRDPASSSVFFFHLPVAEFPPTPCAFAPPQLQRSSEKLAHRFYLKP